jgi:hypothetical protein
MKRASLLPSQLEHDRGSAARAVSGTRRAARPVAPTPRISVEEAESILAAAREAEEWTDVDLSELRIEEGAPRLIDTVPPQAEADAEHPFLLCRKK